MSSCCSCCRQNRRAFTLVEVLVVVAILALIMSILLPSLARARESARAAQCASNLHQLATASTMYAGDNRSVMPGPLHPMIFRETYDAFYRSRDADTSGYDDGFYRRAHLVYYVRKYFTEKSKTATLTDRVSTCPTADILMVTNVKKLIESGAAPALYPGYRPFHYIINSDQTGSGQLGNTRSRPPYYGTKPPFYFGVIYHGWSLRAWGQTGADGLSDFDRQYGLKPGRRIPKKIESILSPSGEWMFADAWYAEIQGARCGGTWPYMQGDSSALSPTGSLMMIPNFAYHHTSRQFDLTIQSANSAANTANSPRFTEGRTNAAYFDGHVASKRVWKGAGNPCWADDANCN